MQEVLPAFSLDLHPPFFLSFSGATPLHKPCGKAAVVIFTAEKPSNAVERDVGGKCEWNPLSKSGQVCSQGFKVEKW